MESLVLGFCKCENCGFERFVWQTYFICPKCGCRKYKQTGLNRNRLWFVEEEEWTDDEQESGEDCVRDFSGDGSMACF